jgi:hypothetical protein
MIDDKREKELEKLFAEYKSDLKNVEKLLKRHELPSNLSPVIREQMESRVVGKALKGIMYRDDAKEIYKQKAEAIKHYYDSLRKQGFDHDTALTIICGLEDEGGIIAKNVENEDEEE